MSVQRDTTAWAAARCVGAWLQHQVACLEGAKDLVQVADSMQAVVKVFIHPELDHHAEDQPRLCTVDDQLQQGVLQQGQVVGLPALRQCFYENQFDSWATAVLTVAAGEWLPRDQGNHLRQLIADTFHSSPAAVALAALIMHLSAVLPKHSSQHSSTAVTAVAAGTAADLLAERFAAPGSCGITQLLSSCDKQVTQAEGCNNAVDNQQQQQQQQQQLSHDAWQFMPCLTAERIDEAAQQLASAPDRAQQLPETPALLTPSRFVPHSIQQALEYLVSMSSSSVDTLPDRKVAAVVAAAAPGALALVTRLLQKFVTRGHAKPAAAALLQVAASGSAMQMLPVVQLLLLQLSSHAAATEKLLVQLLQATSQQQQQQEQLKALLCPLLAVDGKLRTTVLHNLLLRRTLSVSCLHNLVAVLAAVRPSLVPEAAVVLAQAWSDHSTCLNAAVPQQAYMTAALLQCIELLPKEMLDPAAAVSATAAAAAAAGEPTAEASSCQDLLAAMKQLPIAAAAAAAVVDPYQGIGQQQLTTLIPSILQGVSLRLASPLPAIRLQAMRVGRGFAAKLDPTKSLFEEAGDLVLLAEEMWPGALGNAPQQQGKLALAAAAAVNSKQHDSSRCSKFHVLNRLQEADLEPDSDDDEDFCPSTPSVAAAAAATASAAAAAQSPMQQHVGGDMASDGSNGTGVGTYDVAAAADDMDDRDAISDAGSEGSVSSLVAFDLQEDPAAEAWWGPDGFGLPEGKPLGLRAVAAALRKHDDINAVLDALARVEVLVRAAPDELPVVAPELARSLLHCKVPVWAANAQQNLGKDPGQITGLNPNAEVQRQHSLTAVLSLSPLTAGDTMIAELYSPHLDQYQRMLILDSLAAAAGEMSNPRKAPRLAAAAPGCAPKLLPSAAAEAAAAKRAAAVSGTHTARKLPAAAAAAAAAAASSTGASADSSTKVSAAAPGMVESSSRVWGKVSLQKQKAAQAAAAGSQAEPGVSGPVRTFRNRFAPVAVRWASLLLKECDVRKHAVDLFGRDSMLLGRLLTVLGTFVECAAGTPAAVPLSAGLLELLKAPKVSSHKEVFVRRSALVAAAQVVRHLPPARLAGAMIGRQQDVQDAVLVERLQWLMSWAQSVASSDVDEHCRVLAGGCVAWHVELAEGAMAALEHLPEAQGPSLSAVRRGTKCIKRAGEGVEIIVPSVQQRLVLQ